MHEKADTMSVKNGSKDIANWAKERDRYAKKKILFAYPNPFIAEKIDQLSENERQEWETRFAETDRVQNSHQRIIEMSLKKTK